MPHITEDTFVILARRKLGRSWWFSLAMFRWYDRDWRFDVMLNLLYAAGQGKVNRVLVILGVCKILPFAPRRRVFDYIREKMLGLPSMRVSS